MHGNMKKAIFRGLMTGSIWLRKHWLFRNKSWCWIHLRILVGGSILRSRTYSYSFSLIAIQALVMVWLQLYTFAFWCCVVIQCVAHVVLLHFHMSSQFVYQFLNWTENLMFWSLSCDLCQTVFLGLEMLILPIFSLFLEKETQITEEKQMTEEMSPGQSLRGSSKSNLYFISREGNTIWHCFFYLLIQIFRWNFHSMVVFCVSDIAQNNVTVLPSTLLDNSTHHSISKAGELCKWLPQHWKWPTSLLQCWTYWGCWVTTVVVLLLNILSLWPFLWK